METTCPKRTVRDIALRGKRVLVRADLDVVLGEDGEVADETKVRAAAETVKFLRIQGARVVLSGHMGQPRGTAVPAMRMDPVAALLAEVLECPVIKVDGCVEDDVVERVRGARPDAVVLLENVRFYRGEEINDLTFANGLARHGEIFVNDDFASSHRAHASVAGIAQFLPAYAGLGMEKDLASLERLRRTAERPVLGLLGGAGTPDKVAGVLGLSRVADKVFVGGATASVFLKALGHEVGRAVVEADQMLLARRIMDELGERLILPSDVVLGEDAQSRRSRGVARVEAIPADLTALDIGPETIKRVESEIKAAATSVWIGPMGAFENPAFREGTERVARALIQRKSTVVAGGGETAAALHQLGLAERVTHVTTGGGACLEYLDGKPLPGIAVLRDREESPRMEG